MYICICNGVTEREIQRCIAEGARALADLQRELGVAAGCGQCAASAKCLLREARHAPALGDALQAAA